MNMMITNIEDKIGVERISVILKAIQEVKIKQTEILRWSNISKVTINLYLHYKKKRILRPFVLTDQLI